MEAEPSNKTDTLGKPRVSQHIFTDALFQPLDSEKQNEIETVMKAKQRVVEDWYAECEANKNQGAPSPVMPQSVQHPFRQGCHASLRAVCSLDARWSPPDNSPPGFSNDEVCSL